MSQDVNQILAAQRAYFQSGATLSVDGRVAALRRLRDVVRANEQRICDALQADLGKSDYEGFMCEVGLTLGEATYMIKHTRRLAARYYVPTPLAQFAASSFTQAGPLGCTLIMSPWNYPFMLTMEPLINAIAAGNTAVLKPSAYSPATSALIAEIVAECFEPEYVAVVTGGRKENAELLNAHFDFIFFTGSQAVGREVLRHTAETLTPAVLELGGKSPCIVDETAKLDLAAKRIAFGKWLNCGQTCVAPDYILCQRSVHEQFVEALKQQARKQYGERPLENADYGRMVNQKHFERVNGLVQASAGKVVLGGGANAETLQIEPTIMDNVTWDDAIMGEEIFGPVAPVLVYDDISEVYDMLVCRPKPLALYLFSENSTRQREVLSRCQFGGGCVNDTIIHLATSAMPFGGTGESGMGGYHGKRGFEAFSHEKSIVDKATWMDLPMRYQPYQRSLYSKLLHLFLR